MTEPTPQDPVPPRALAAWLALAVAAWATVYLQFIVAAMPLFTLQALRPYDEGVQAVVAANLGRRLFPPAVRLNPVEDAYAGWTEGPLWQHVPPLFAYLPLPAFVASGAPDIGAFRLTFAAAQGLVGALLLTIAAIVGRTRTAVAAGLLAAVLWLATPYSRAVVTGETFGVSDLLLTGAVTGAAGAIAAAWVARQGPRRVGLEVGLGLACAFPVVVKSALGAIPLATLVLLRGRAPRSLVVPLAAAALLLLVAFAPLYFADATTFREAVGAVGGHLRGEGEFDQWAGPWHAWLTAILPTAYAPGGWYLVLALGLAVASWQLRRGAGATGERALMGVGLGWFAWMLVAISAVPTKSPNFAYQAWLLAVFAAVLGVASLARQAVTQPGRSLSALDRLAPALAMALGIAALGSAWQVGRAHEAARATPNPAPIALERGYAFGVAARARGWGPRDLVLMATGQGDHWLRYPLMFHTGAEARNLGWLLARMETRPEVRANVAARYDRAWVVVGPGAAAPVPVRALVGPREAWGAGFDAFPLAPRALSGLRPARPAGHGPSSGP